MRDRPSVGSDPAMTRHDTTFWVKAATEQGAPAWHLMADDVNGIARALISFATEAEAKAVADYVNDIDADKANDERTPNTRTRCCK
jgi:hypothetical protein